VNRHTTSTHPRLTRKQLACISALADGSLPEEQRPEVEALLARSSELRAAYERERRVVQVLHGARERDHAPGQLRARLAAQPPVRDRTRSRGVALGGALAAGLAAAGLAVAFLLPTGTPGAPTPSQAALLATRGASLPAPVPDARDPSRRLRQAVNDVYFPNWGRGIGWRATGQRIDRLRGHRVVTVYYAHGAKTVAYSIVSPPALPQGGGRPVMNAGLVVRAFKTGGRVVVTWRRSGDTCVLSTTDTTAAELAQLAAWGPRR
jgi:hypothetical protein